MPIVQFAGKRSASEAAAHKPRDHGKANSRSLWSH